MSVKRVFSDRLQLYSLCLNSLALLLIAFNSSVQAAPPDPANGVVILKVYYANSDPQLGTGFFVDHDGLIVTADHIINRYKNPPGPVPFNPGKGDKAVKIEVYSRALPGGKRVIDIARDKVKVVEGRINESIWLDIAFFRLDINDDVRRLVEPLDIAMDIPQLKVPVYPYGPICNDINNSSCFTVKDGPPTASISNQPDGADEYIVSALLTEGYSGGPLLDNANRVVGIDSRGEIIGLGTDTKTSYYLPSRDLFYYSDSLPPSKFFDQARACDNIAPLTRMTQFDWVQVSAPWPANSKLDNKQCECCCSSISKISNPVTYKGFVDIKCGGPACKKKNLVALINAGVMETARREPDLQKIATLNTAIGALYKDILEDKSEIPDGERADIYRLFGSFQARLATGRGTSTSPLFSDAVLYALQAYGSAQKLNPTVDGFQQLAILFAQLDDPNKADMAKRAASLTEQEEKGLVSRKFIETHTTFRYESNSVTNSAMRATALYAGRQQFK